jgi:hypothetical protein
VKTIDEVECELCEIMDFCEDCIDAHYIEYHPDSEKTKEILKDEPPFPVNKFDKWDIERRI